MIGLMRLRRFRTPIILSIFIVLVLYQFTSLKETSVFSVEKLKAYSPHKPILGHDGKTTLSEQPEKPIVKEPIIKEPTAIIPLPSLSTPVAKPNVRPDPQSGKILGESSPPEPKAKDEKPSTKLDSSADNKPPVIDIPSEEDEALKLGSVLDSGVPDRPAHRPGVIPVAPGNTAVSEDTTTPHKPIPPKKPEHWKKDPVFFPVPKKSIIPLPTGKPKKIPQIQASFAPEPETNRKARVVRQDAVRNAFLHSWNIYKEEAWGHDELIPVSGGYRDKFGGWGASLVDALDTLWIMGLKEEFEEAVAAVRLIDFTFTTMNDIPIFETTIRYIGGLVGAYDVSGQKYPVLLEKAIEIADVVYGSFDTPNRMPQLYYRWKGRQRSEENKSGSRVVMAEIGTLSLEFTRLSQITGNDSYYDAIARVTNALDEYQMHSSLPGLWPMHADGSGCKGDRKALTNAAAKKLASSVKNSPTVANNGVSEKPILMSDTVGGTGKELSAKIGKDRTPQKPKSPGKGVTEVPIKISDVMGGTGKEVFPGPPNQLNEDTTDEPHVHSPQKRSEKSQSLESLVSVDEDEQVEEAVIVKKKPEMCEAELLNPVGAHVERFGLGALIDSLYEYLLKEYLLLGGVEEANQYKRLYTSSMDLVKEKLLFRPNVPGNPDVLLPGILKVDSLGEVFTPISSHLACFGGGMFAMGAQVFDRNDDLEVGGKLADGCVWAYASMKSGIMPEEFTVDICNKTKKCKYSEAAWIKSMMPSQEEVDRQNQYLKSLAESALETPITPKETSRKKPKGRNKPTSNDEISVHHGVQEPEEVSEVYELDSGSPEVQDPDDEVLKVHESEDEAPVHAPQRKRSSPNTIHITSGHVEPEVHSFDKTVTGPQDDEYWARQVIKERNIPPGFQDINDRKYILRPEAIESVWYMYRISADKTWQDKGWKMFQAVNNATLSKLAHSAITDVNSLKGDTFFEYRDEMESFWFGETLKYFYLLFSEPDLISLDDYVLNTEAHPFKRPKATKE